MRKFCRAAMITYKGELVCARQPMPELRDNEVLVKVHCSLISPGTEMCRVRAFRETPEPSGQQWGFGYSSAGEIVAINGEARGLKVGMRVACMGGGARHADWNAVPINLVVPMPDGISYEEATFASLAATSLQAVRRADPRLGEYGMVLGLGLVGNLAAQLSVISGARVLAWESMRNRRAIAKKCGIPDAVDFTKVDASAAAREFAAPYGMDFAIMAFGGNADAAFQSVVKAMKVSADGHVMGRVSVVGGCNFRFTGGATTGNLDVRCSARTGAGYHDDAWEHGRDYPDVFVQFTSLRNARELLLLIAEKRLKVTPMITHRLKLADVGQAADLLVDHPDKTLGVILDMD